MSEIFAFLVSKRIESVWIHPNQDALIIVVKNDDNTETQHVFRTEGDCCANAYFAGATGADALQGGMVIDTHVEDVGSKENGDYDTTDTCFYTIATLKGRCTLELRTEHNGYYCGWINYCENQTIDLVAEKAIRLRDYENQLEQ